MAKQPADGYIIGVIGTDGMALLPFVTKTLPFDPYKDLVAVHGLGEARYALTANASKSFTKSYNDLIAYAKANPGKINYGTSTIQVHFPLMVLAEHHKLNWVHIPFPGGGPYLQALAAGTVDVGITGEGSANGLGDRVRVLAITGDTRAAKFPDAPTFGELGFPTVRGPAYAIMVRAGTPKEVVDKLGAATGAALNTTEVQTGFSRMLLALTADKQDAATKKVAGQFAFYADFTKRLGIKPE